MVKARPINSKGEPTGPVRNFPDKQWEKMTRHFGSKIAWQKVEQSPASPLKEEPRELRLIAENAPVGTKAATNKTKK